MVIELGYQLKGIRLGLANLSTRRQANRFFFGALNQDRFFWTGRFSDKKGELDERKVKKLLTDLRQGS